MMNIKPIPSNADNKVALKLVSKPVGMGAAPNTPEGDILEVMSTLIAAYETKRSPNGRRWLKGRQITTWANFACETRS